MFIINYNRLNNLLSYIFKITIQKLTHFLNYNNSVRKINFNNKN